MMISAVPFSLSVLADHRAFYVLDHIDADAVELFRRTPAGDDPFTNADVYRMGNGQLLVALRNPFSASFNLHLVAKDGTQEEIVNLELYERLLEFIDIVPSEDTSNQGGFAFSRSSVVIKPEQDWRCDNTLYGVNQWNETDEEVVTKHDDLLFWEPVLSVNGVAHLQYIHVRNSAEAREKWVHNAVRPILGFTIGEAMKLIHEWATVADAPFNNVEDIAVAAREFLGVLGFEPSMVANQPDMHVASYLRGSTTARQRPTNPAPASDELRHFIMKRTSFSTLSALTLVYPGLADTQQIWQEEQRQLHIGIQKFRNYYGLDLSIPITNADAVVAVSEKNRPLTEAYVRNQLRLFRNKRSLLDRVENASDL
jgi:hypothetical protein